MSAKNVTIIGKITGYKYKSTSYYGNPSYYVWGIDENNVSFFGYTASNASAGYTVGNFPETTKQIKGHYTKSGNLIIDFIREV